MLCDLRFQQGAFCEGRHVAGTTTPTPVPWYILRQQAGCEGFRYVSLQTNRHALQIAKPNLQYKKDCILEILKGAIEVGKPTSTRLV